MVAIRILKYNPTKRRLQTMKMTKRTLSAGVLSAMILFSPITGGSTVEASTQPIMWGQNELSKTQLGRIVFTKDVKVYKRGADNVPKFHLNAKKGSLWRVHKITKEGDRYVYDLGGGVRVQQSSLSKFERPPVELIKKQVQEYGAIIEMDGVYPTVSRLVSKAVEDKINNRIKSFYNGFSNENTLITAIRKNADKDSELTLELIVSDYSEEMGLRYSVHLDTYNLTTGELIHSASDYYR